jgi:gliding motility-associated-like protein
VVTLTAAGGTAGQYRWYTVPSGGTALAGEVNASYTTPSLSIATTYYVTIINGTCESSRTPVTASIQTTPAAPSANAVERCGAGSVTLSASGGTNGDYRWFVSTSSPPISGQQNSTLTQTVSTTTTYYVAVVQGNCSSAQTAVPVTVLPVPATPVVTSTVAIVNNQLEICTSTPATLTAPAGFSSYNWSTGSTAASIVVSQAGTVTLTVTNSVGCVSPPRSTTVTVRNCVPTIAPPPPQVIPIEGQLSINISSLITSILPINLSTLRVVVAPTSGAKASFSPSGELRIDYSGVLFAGQDRLTIEVCNVAGECGSQEISVEVVGGIIIYNGMSPNGDGINDYFEIKYIEVLPAARENRVLIFNRWGDMLWRTDNYNNTTNRFEGLNQNGNEIPSGEYFYKIQFESGAPMRTGFLSLKR